MKCNGKTNQLTLPAVFATGDVALACSGSGSEGVAPPPAGGGGGGGGDRSGAARRALCRFGGAIIALCAAQSEL